MAKSIMNIEIDENEIQEGKYLIEEYKNCPGDGSYWHHIANWAINLLIKKKVVEEFRL